LLGKNAEQRWDLAYALACLDEALVMYRDLSSVTPFSIAQAQCHEKIGDIRWWLDDIQGALENYRSAMDHMSMHVSIDGGAQSLDLRRAMVRVHVSIGNCLKRMSNMRGAEESLLHAHELARDLADHYGSPADLRLVGMVLDSEGDIAFQQQQHDVALQKHGAALSLRRQIVKEVPTPEHLRDVSTSLDRIGSLHDARKDPEQALVFYRESLDVSRQVAGLSEALNYANDVVAQSCVVSRALLTRMRAAEAIAVLHIASEQATRVENHAGDDVYLLDTAALFHEVLADALHILGDTSGADMHTQRALEFRKKLLAAS
jgi:tetratricopeptide (TPR) repeat protein